MSIVTPGTSCSPCWVVHVAQDPVPCTRSESHEHAPGGWHTRRVVRPRTYWIPHSCWRSTVDNVCNTDLCTIKKHKHIEKDNVCSADLCTWNKQTSWELLDDWQYDTYGYNYSHTSKRVSTSNLIRLWW